MIVISITITVVYCFLIGSFCWGFGRVKAFTLSNIKPSTHFSIVVPFRNEAKQLPAFLESISRLKYPKALFEVILVDDASEDDSRELLDTFRKTGGNNSITIAVMDSIRTTASPKKDAITLAISKARYDWIITTDADCVLPQYWLESIDEFIQNKAPHLIVAPVTYYQVTGFLQNFQLLDVLSLQGATIGGFGIKNPFLCNGANLAYTKQLFNSLKGFEGNSNVASGDDVFFLEKALQHNPNQVHYLKCKHAIVSTKALSSTTEMVDQRVRWAAKSSSYKNVFGKLAGSIVFSQNALLILCFCLVVIGELRPQVLFYVFVIKSAIDLLLIYQSVVFFDQKKHLKQYIPASFCYPFFSVYVVFIAVFKGYRWKERSYRQ